MSYFETRLRSGQYEKLLYEFPNNFVCLSLIFHVSVGILKMYLSSEILILPQTPWNLLSWSTCNHNKPIMINCWMSVSSSLQVSWCYGPNMIELVDLVSVLEKCVSTTYNVDGITNCSCTLSGCFETHFMLTKLCSFENILFESPGHMNE